MLGTLNSGPKWPLIFEELTPQFSLHSDPFLMKGLKLTCLTPTNEAAKYSF